MYRIALQAYRSFRNADWAIDGTSLLVGPNGSGKTTLCRAAELLRMAFDHGPADAIYHQGGSYALKCFESPPDQSPVVQMQIGACTWEIELRSVDPGGPLLIGESFTSGGDVLLERKPGASTFDFKGDSVACDDRMALRVAFEKFDHSEVRRFADQLRSIRYYATYTGLDNLRKRGSEDRQDQFLHWSGSNAFSVLRTWKTLKREQARFDFVAEILRDAFPEVPHEIDFALAPGVVTISLLRSDDREIPVRFAPHGWLLGLMQLTAVAGAENGSLVFIEEFENALHPYAIHKLLGAIRNWCADHDICLCLTTHSPVVIDAFADDLSHLFALRPETETVPSALDTLYDREWLSSFSLGRLYTTSELAPPKLS